MRFSLLLSAILFVTGCGSGGGGADGAASTASPARGTIVITEYYDSPANTQIAATGPVQVGSDGRPTTIKEGIWSFNFPPDQGLGRQYVKTFVAGVWDQAQAWQERNVDGSIRIDSSDR